jgi:hypothetical protein
MRLTAAEGIIAASILTIFAGTAQAAEWRYCLAPARAEHKVYMSYPFRSAVDYRKLEEMFRSSLSRAHFSVDYVQCPLGENQRSLLAMREDAVAFNRQMQMTVVDLEWAP